VDGVIILKPILGKYVVKKEVELMDSGLCFSADFVLIVLNLWVLPPEN